MVKRLCLLTLLVAVVGTLTAAQSPAARSGADSTPAGRKVALGDWPDARGPLRDGRSQEKGLIDKWALKGENFLWRAPYGGRSAPLAIGK